LQFDDGQLAQYAVPSHSDRLSPPHQEVTAARLPDKSAARNNGGMMNLMFWKKKPGTENGAEELRDDSAVNDQAQESSDSIAPTQDADESDPASSTPKTGLAARIKSILATLVSRFKKTPAPAPDAEEGQGKDTRRRSKDNPEDAEEAPVKLGLVAQIRSKLIALTLRLKEAPEPDAEEKQGKDTRRRSKDDQEDAEEAPKEPSLFGLVKLLLAAFISHYKKRLIFTLLLLLLIGIAYATWDIIFPPLIRTSTTLEPQTKSEALNKKSELLKKKSDEAQARADALRKESEATHTEAEALKKKEEEEKARAESLRKKEEEEKAQAEALKKKEEEEKARAEAEALLKKEAEEKAQAEALIKKQAEEKAQAEAKALMKKEAEEKARAAAFKKSPRQRQLPGSPTPQTGSNTAPALGSGEVAVGGKDSNATTKSLKEAIDAMNADTGGSSKSTAK
jgi:hypothetical protein